VSKLTAVIVLLMLGLLALVAVQNNEVTTLNLPFYGPYDISKIALILSSYVLGAVFVLLLFIIRDARRFMTSYQLQRRQKRDEKIESMYSAAVNAILADDEVEARKTMEEVLKVEPEHANCLLRLGDLAMRRQRLEEAMGFYKRAHAAAPPNLEALFSIVNVMEALKKWPEALGYVEKILEADPDNMSALVRKRLILEEQGRWDDVIDVQKTIIKHEREGKDREREQKTLLGLRYEHARDSLEKGEMEKANKGFRAILRDDSGFIPAYLGVAEVLLGEREPEEAVSFLEKAYETTSSIIVLARLEDLLITLGEPSRLLRTYRKAVSEHPGDDVLRFFMAKLFYRLEMIDDAMETLQSLDTAETYPHVYRLLGELHLRRDQCMKAVEQFKKIIKPRKALRLHYSCGVCGFNQREWSGRCPNCGNWNSFMFNLHDRRKA